MEALILQGADALFSYPGGVILPIYDILGDYPEIRHILVRHEQGGGHAADGYARASGRVGVCMGTSGPGATNLVTAIATAQLDSVPMVAITGNVPAALIGKDAFQEIDITGITLPMTKHNYLVRNADDIPRVVAEAFYIARSGRPGPVHVDITKDALQQETRAEHPSLDDVVAGLPGFRPTIEGHPKQLKIAAREIAAAKRPADPRRARRADRRGVGRARARSPRRRDPGRLDAARHRRDGRGASPRVRLHGDARLEARQPRDPVGRPADRDRHALRRPGHRQRPDLRPVRADHPRGHRPGRDRQERGRRGPDRRRREERPGRPRRRWSRRRRWTTGATTSPSSPSWGASRWAARWHGSGAWRDGLLSADFVVERIGELTDHVANYVADVGQNQMWLARYTGFRRPHSHISSGGLGTMGFCVPAAMGAALGQPESETWAV